MSDKKLYYDVSGVTGQLRKFEYYGPCEYSIHSILVRELHPNLDSIRNIPECFLSETELEAWEKYMSDQEEHIQDLDTQIIELDQEIDRHRRNIVRAQKIINAYTTQH